MTAAASTKTDNGELARAAKVAMVAMRQHVLALVNPARVFDAFCGETGQMHAEVWHRADSYLGCDRAWRVTDTRRRLIGDSLLALRAIDLGAFNVFDLDTYGGPWEAALILAARRRWKPGEVGAVVLTDGLDMKLKFGGRTRAIEALLGTNPTANTDKARESVQHGLLRAWTSRAGVVPLKLWRARGFSGQTGGIAMMYSAIVFEGARRPTAHRASAHA